MNIPGAVTRSYPGWRLIGYRHEGTYLGFVALQNHVRLGFERGVYMNDPDGLPLATLPPKKTPALRRK